MSQVLTAAARVAADAAEAHRHAYNVAFDQLGLPWHWDSTTYARLLDHGDDGVLRYLETERPHLLRAYEPGFLVAAVEAAKARCLCGMSGNKRNQPLRERA